MKIRLLGQRNALGGGVHFAFEMAGSVQAMELAYRVTRRGGTTVSAGLPHPDQWTTARDMATLGRRLAHDFPEQYRYFAAPSFRFRGKTIMTHDHLLATYQGADGIKTGYTDASGFNLVTSAVRGGTRLVGVVLGAGVT